MSNILVFSVKAILHATIILVFLLQFFDLPAVFTFRLYYLYSFNCRSQRKDVYHLMIYAVICIERTLLIHEKMYVNIPPFPRKLRSTGSEEIMN